MTERKRYILVPIGPEPSHYREWWKDGVLHRQTVFGDGPPAEPLTPDTPYAKWECLD